MRPSDDDFEVVEEVVEDFDYFYEDETEQSRNKKIVRKFKILSAVLISLFVVLLLFVVGAIQMQVYNTKKVVTHSLIVKKTYYNEIEKYYDYAKSFYNVKVVNDSVIESGVYCEINNIYEQNKLFTSDTDLKAKEILEMVEEYYAMREDLKLKVPKDYLDFDGTLDLYFEKINDFANSVINNDATVFSNANKNLFKNLSKSINESYSLCNFE